MDPIDEPLGGWDVSEVPTVEDFDLDAWLDGGRPTRRAIAVHIRGDVVARLEELADAIEAAEDDDERAELETEAEDLQQVFAASRRTFVIEAKSSEWVQSFRDQQVRAGLKLGEKSGRAADRLAFSLRLLAEQIVTPSGVTEAHLRRMAEVAEPEVLRLIGVQEAANALSAASVGVVTRDFSRGR